MKYKYWFTSVSEKISKNRAIGAPAKAIYTAMRTYGPVCYPSYTALMRDSCIRSKTTLRKYLLYLEIMGFIQVIRKYKRSYYLFPIERDYAYRKSQLDSLLGGPKNDRKLVQKMDSNINDLKLNNTTDENLADMKSIQDGLSSIIRKMGMNQNV